MSFQGVKLPKDAMGREIPLSTKVLYYKGSVASNVSNFIYWPNEDRWVVILYGFFKNYETSDFLLFPPDSWEQLEHDATLAPRDYLQARGIEERKDGRIATMMSDLVRRAKILAETEKRNA